MGAAEILDELGGLLLVFGGEDDLALHCPIIHRLINRIGGEQAAEGVLPNPALCVFFTGKTGRHIPAAAALEHPNPIIRPAHAAAPWFSRSNSAPSLPNSASVPPISNQTCWFASPLPSRCQAAQLYTPWSSWVWPAPDTCRQNSKATAVRFTAMVSGWLSERHQR